jgi:TolB-like protein
MARFWPQAALSVALTLIASTAIGAPRVAVLPVEFDGRVPDVSRISLSERLVEGLARAGFEVSAGDVLKSALHNNPAPESCHAPACYKQIAAKLSLDYLVLAQVKIKERNYELKLQLVKGRDGKPSSEERESCELCGIQEVGEKLDKLASSLMSHVGPQRSDPAHLTVQSEPAGASVTVDGRAAGETPLSVELSPGSHEVAVAAAGHAGANKKIILEPGIRGLVSVDLLPLSGGSARSGPPPALWWAAIGVGAGAVGTGLAIWQFVDHQEVVCPGEAKILTNRRCFTNARLPVGLLLGAGGLAILTGSTMLFVDWGHTQGAGETAHAQHWMVSASGTF